MPIEPDRGAARPRSERDRRRPTDDGPVVMLNLNRYRDRAAYESAPGGGAPTSRREAYARYGAVALPSLERVGGRILWYAEAERDRDRRRERPLRRGRSPSGTRAGPRSSTSP